MSTSLIVLIVILVILIGALVALYFMGRRAEKRKAEQDAQLQAAAQNVSMLIIDKKRLPLKKAGLPDQVVQQAPFYARRAKLPIVKAKVGPQTLNLICDEGIFDEVPVKKEVKARVSGLYILSVRGLHGKRDVVDKTKKKGFKAWARRKSQELQSK